MSRHAVTGFVIAASCLVGLACDSQPDDPSVLECETGPWMQVATVESGRSFASKMDAVAAVAFDIGADGHPVPDDAEFVELADEPGHQVAVRVDGRTVLILRLEGQAGSWSVGGYTQC